MRRGFCWLMYMIAVYWPFSCFDGMGGRIFFALLPWAGEWAYYWSEPPEYRQQMDLSE